MSQALSERLSVLLQYLLPKQALTVLAGLRPGAPLCRAWSDDARRDGLELVLKGGQMGTPSFYGEVLSGAVHD